ncbi:DUF2244 domain-containing protein [Nereida ignava]|uniref:DUF2244 domain-containing protein n=1 Tax=Nereida ignava TaxID=282199 RepID=UPI001F20D953|nr:DUF2244 domain-containing protein [Nereida ignava]
MASIANSQEQPNFWARIDTQATDDMPYQITNQNPCTITLWPHQSMTPQGFVWFIGITSSLIFLPAIAILGSPVVWGLLPFFIIALWAVWSAIRRNQKDAAVRETLTIDCETTALSRINPRAPAQNWQANTYWVSAHMHTKAGPVENYVTLKGANREVELGAFLSADERVTLYDDVQRLLKEHREATLSYSADP